MLRNTSKQYIRTTVYGVGRKHDDFNVSALFRYYKDTKKAELNITIGYG